MARDAKKISKKLKPSTATGSVTKMESKRDDSSNNPPNDFIFRIKLLLNKPKNDRVTFVIKSIAILRVNIFPTCNIKRATDLLPTTHLIKLKHSRNTVLYPDASTIWIRNGLKKILSL